MTAPLFNRALDVHMSNAAVYRHRRAVRFAKIGEIVCGILGTAALVVVWLLWLLPEAGK